MVLLLWMVERAMVSSLEVNLAAPSIGLELKALMNV